MKIPRPKYEAGLKKWNGSILSFLIQKKMKYNKALKSSKPILILAFVYYKIK